MAINSRDKEVSKIVKILDEVLGSDTCVAAISAGAPSAQLQATRLRQHLSEFISLAAHGELPVVSPPPQPGWSKRGAGHLHLNAELFLQIQGHTQFHFPHGQVTLRAGEALVMPPKLLHDEWVAGDGEQAFSNMVIHADSQTMTCHLAHELPHGRPGNLYLEGCQHVETTRIETWLQDATKRPEHDTHGLWQVQQRALILSALTSVSRLLDAPVQTASTEPVLLSKLRVLLQNRLGDPELTVANLAATLGCTADYLSHLFSDTTGTQLWQVVQRERLQRAARLLTETDTAVKEIAWCCGYASASYFTRSFRGQFGLTPKVYRERLADPLLK